MPGSDQCPLSPAQRQAATELPWYRAWLLSTGRTVAEVDLATNQRGALVDVAVAGAAQEQPPVDLGFLNSPVETDEQRRAYLAGV
jgi:hypothetical protein